MNITRPVVMFLLAVSVGWAGNETGPDKPNAGKRGIVPATKQVTYLGVYVTPVDDVLAEQLQLDAGVGLVVKSVANGSPAAKATVQKHDILIRLDDQLLINSAQLAALIRLKKDGDKVTLKVRRAGKEVSLGATLRSKEVAVRRSQPIWRAPRFNLPSQGIQLERIDIVGNMPENSEMTNMPKVQFDFSQINKIFSDPKLDDKEKSGKINQLLRKQGFGNASISINGKAIDLFGSTTKLNPKSQGQNPKQNFDKMIEESLKILPAATRKRIEERLKGKDGKFKTNIRILHTPNGPVFIMESSSIQFRPMYFRVQRG